MLLKSLNLPKLFILLFISLNLYADIYDVALYSNKNKCIFYDYYFKSSKFNYRYATSPDTWRSTTSTKPIIIEGFEYNTTSQKCYLKPVLQDLHISYNNYESLLAVVAILIGFIFLFFGIYIAVEVAKK